MAINFSDPAQTTNQGQPIPINSQGGYDSALNAVRQIYADVGHAIDGDDIQDMENRIRGGQTMAELVANTYDQAQRRFKVPDTPTTRAEEAAGLRPTYDSQLNQGRAFDPPAVMLEQLALPSREQAPLMNGSALATVQRGTPINTPRYNVGPTGLYAGAGYDPSTGTMPSLATLLLLAGGGLLLFVLLRRKGRHA